MYYRIGPWPSSTFGLAAPGGAGGAAAPRPAPIAAPATSAAPAPPTNVPTVGESYTATPQLRTMFPETWIWVDQIAK